MNLEGISSLDELVGKTISRAIDDGGVLIVYFTDGSSLDVDIDGGNYQPPHMSGCDEPPKLSVELITPAPSQSDLPKLKLYPGTISEAHAHSLARAHWVIGDYRYCYSIDPQTDKQYRFGGRVFRLSVLMTNSYTVFYWVPSIRRLLVDVFKFDDGIVYVTGVEQLELNTGDLEFGSIHAIVQSYLMGYDTVKLVPRTPIE